jgi:phosphate transport system substrate-binding protein
MATTSVKSLMCILALFVTYTAAAGGDDRVIVAGSTTVKPIVDEGVRAFQKAHPGVNFLVGAGGSGQGIQLVGTGKVNLSMASRLPDIKEREQFADLVQHTIGLDGVVMVANVSNAVGNLTKEQVERIYAGEITNWKQLGGKDRPIALITLNTKHGTNEVFLTYFGLETTESGNNATATARFRSKGQQAYSEVSAKVIEDHRQVLAEVLTNPNALGYVSIGQAMQVAAKGARVRLLELDGVAPTIANVRSGVYVFSRPLLLITKGEARGNVRDFIDFLSGPEGQAIVAKMDYIPVAAKQ